MLDELAARPAIERELRERWIEALAQIARQYGGVLWHYPDRRRLKQVGQHMLALATWAQREDKPAVLLQFVPALLIYFDMLGYLVRDARAGPGWPGVCPAQRRPAKRDAD